MPSLAQYTFTANSNSLSGGFGSIDNNALTTVASLKSAWLAANPTVPYAG